MTFSSSCRDVMAHAWSCIGLVSVFCSAFSAHVWETGRDFYAVCGYGTAKCCALPLASEYSLGTLMCYDAVCHHFYCSHSTSLQLLVSSIHCTSLWLSSVFQLVDADARVHGAFQGL